MSKHEIQKRTYKGWEIGSVFECFEIDGEEEGAEEEGDREEEDVGSVAAPNARQLATEPEIRIRTLFQRSVITS